MSDKVWAVFYIIFSILLLVSIYSSMSNGVFSPFYPLGIMSGIIVIVRSIKVLCSKERADIDG